MFHISIRPDHTIVGISKYASESLHEFACGKCESADYDTVNDIMYITYRIKSKQDVMLIVAMGVGVQCTFFVEDK